MVSILMLAVGMGSLVAGPALLVAAERTTGMLLVTRVRTRFVVAAVMSAATGVLSWAGWLRLGPSPVWLAWCWASALGCGLVLTDLRCHRLPFPLVATLAGGGFVVLIGATLIDGTWFRLGFACLAAVVVFGLASLVQLWAPDHTGGGDTALLAALALYLGWFGWDGLLRGLMIASGLTAIVALVVAASSKSTRSRFPAGPSLLAGALMSILLT